DKHLCRRVQGVNVYDRNLLPAPVDLLTASRGVTTHKMPHVFGRRVEAPPERVKRSTSNGSARHHRVERWRVEELHEVIKTADPDTVERYCGLGFVTFTRGPFEFPFNTGNHEM